MVRKLEQIRVCDRQCCKDAPQFPNEDRTDCIYSTGIECSLILGTSLVPEGSCPANPKLSAQAAFTKHCVEWPDNMPERDTGRCCWQWVEEEWQR